MVVSKRKNKTTKKKTLTKRIKKKKKSTKLKKKTGIKRITKTKSKTKSKTSIKKKPVVKIIKKKKGGDYTPRYVGSNTSTEGLRHFFILKCIENNTYPTAIGTYKNEFMVYTSTGKNTKYCKDKICIIPCFGTMVLKKLTNNKIITCPIIKSEYYQGLKKNINNDKYNEMNKFYTSLLNNNINNTNRKIYFSKIGSNIFNDTINLYKDNIIKYINNTNNIIEHDNLLFINKNIKDNNIYGIDLSKLDTYSNYINLFEKDFKPCLFYKECKENNNYELINNILLNSLKNILYYQKDVFMNILFSPHESIIYNTIKYYNTKKRKRPNLINTNNNTAR